MSEHSLWIDHPDFDPTTQDGLPAISEERSSR